MGWPGGPIMGWPGWTIGEVSPAADEQPGPDGHNRPHGWMKRLCWDGLGLKPVSGRNSNAECHSMSEAWHRADHAAADSVAY